MENKKIIIANWKIYLNMPDSIEAAANLKKQSKKIKEGKEVVICPSVTSLAEVAKVLKGSIYSLGSQDCFWEERGAYTSCISPLDLRQIGCRYVIIGHSERRKNFLETDEMVHKKVRIALGNHLTPIVCVGEDYDERRSGQRDYVIIKQVTDALKGINVTKDDELIVAYEPVWAISGSGGGIKAEPEEVKYVTQVIRQVLIDLFDGEIVENNLKIIYGGSVDSKSVSAYTNLLYVSGVLVGSASIKPESFIKLINNS